MRILHVVGGMDHGGIQSWLMHILRNIDRDRFRMDFLVHTDAPCAYDEEIRALGSRILPCLDPSRPVTYGRRFRAIVRRSGRYQVVHSHVHHFSGYVAMLARRERVPVRIVHSHTAPVAAGLPLQRRTYLALMKHWIRRHATVGLGVSQEATVSLFGPEWHADGRFRIAYCS
ncbi:MAG: glycosyltransferase, partial [Dehalococcoidia bacterium]